MMWRSQGSLGSGRWPRVLATLLALMFAVLLAGCLFNKDDDYVPEDPADKLYNEGLFLLNSKQDYTGAAKKFDEVDRQIRIPTGRAKRC